MIGEIVDRVRSALPGRSPTASLDEDVVFDALSNQRRRTIFRVLAEYDRGDGVELTRLADLVAAVECDVDGVDGLSDMQVKRVYVSLYQTHIPKMADQDLLEYDKEKGLVRATEETVAAAKTLEDVTPQIEREVVA